MKITIAFACLFSFLLPMASAQQAPQALKIDPNNPNRIQVEEALQRYLSAYARKNFQELLAVWPDLSNSPKEAEKIRRHLEDGSISNEQMSLQPLETVPSSDAVVVRAQRTEEFVKTERTSSIAHGDLNLGAMPTQDPGLAQLEKKKPFKKTDTVWIKLHQTGDHWTIVSVTTQRPQ